MNLETESHSGHTKKNAQSFLSCVESEVWGFSSCNNNRDEYIPKIWYKIVCTNSGGQSYYSMKKKNSVVFKHADVSSEAV